MIHKDCREEYCKALVTWAKLLEGQESSFSDSKEREFTKAWNIVELYITKSCLLDRMIYGGEQPSQTPCPVHKGIWSGIHIGWPGQKWHNGPLMEPSDMCQEWYDAGCRCYQHKCGCTTGWQPDEHCGCLDLVETSG